MTLSRENLKHLILESNIIYTNKNNQQHLLKKIDPFLKEQIILSTEGCRDKISERVFWILNDIYDYPICVECGTQWYPRFYGLSTKNYNEMKFCCNSCMNKNKESLLKKRETWKENYGVSNPAQSRIIQEKMQNTCIERYGVKNSFQSVELREKVKQTCIALFGVENAAQSSIIQEKMQNTCEERYGVKNAMQNEQIRNKVEETNLNKRGVKNVFQCEIIKEKIKETNLERYNVENVAQSSIIQERMKGTCLQRYSVENSSQNLEIHEKQVRNSKKHKKLTLPSGREIYYQGYEDVAIKKLLEDYSEEEIILNRKEIPDIWYLDVNNKRKYFPDIWIPSQNLIIEVKSTWTYEKDLQKNLKKRQATLELGYNFQFWICSDKQILNIL